MEKKEPEIPPPTPEQWQRVPFYIRLHIVIILWWHINVIQGLAWLGLRLGGIKIPKNR